MPRSIVLRAMSEYKSHSWANPSDSLYFVDFLILFVDLFTHLSLYKHTTDSAAPVLT